MRHTHALPLVLAAVLFGCALEPSKLRSDTQPGGALATSTGGAGGTSTGGAGAGGAAPVDQASLPVPCDSTFVDTGAAMNTAEPVWARLLPGSVKPVRAAVDGEGNTIVTNEFSGTIDFGNGMKLEDSASAAQFSVYMAKFSPSGEALWAQEVYPYRAATPVVGDDGFFWTQGESKDGSGEFLLRRWDPSGVMVWEMPILAGARAALRGDRVLLSFFVDEPLTLGTQVLEPAPGAFGEAAVAALDASGKVLWARKLDTFIGPDVLGQPYFSSVTSAAATPDGGAYVIVDTRRNDHDHTPIQADLVRLTTAGDVAWIRRFPPRKFSAGFGLVAGPQGEALLFRGLNDEESVDFGCGPITGYGLVLLKIDPDGRAAWTRTFPGLTLFLRPNFDAEGDILISGPAASPCDLGGGDAALPPESQWFGRLVVAKLRSDGSHLRSGMVGGPLVFPDSPLRYAFNLDPNGDMIVTGTQFQKDTGLGVGPYSGHWAFLAKIKP